MALALNYGEKIKATFGIVMIACGSLLITGCLREEVRLTRDERNLVDSLFLQQRTVLEAQLADSCSSLRERMFSHWVDSMKADRLRDIQKILGK